MTVAAKTRYDNMFFSAQLSSGQKLQGAAAKDLLSSTGLTNQREFSSFRVGQD